jgi:hypothetical protein
MLTLWLAWKSLDTPLAVAAIAPSGSTFGKRSEEERALLMVSRGGPICQVDDPNSPLQLKEVTETTLIASQRAADTNSRLCLLSKRGPAIAMAPSACRASFLNSTSHQTTLPSWIYATDGKNLLYESNSKFSR